MSRRRIVLLCVAVFIATLVAFAVKTRLSIEEGGDKAAVPSLSRVLVAKQEIPAGSTVKAGHDIDWAAWPAEAVQPYYIKEEGADINTYNGSIARRAIHAGEAIPINALIKSGGGGFLSAMVEPGKRAVSLSVTPSSGNAGLVFPGDRVDLIVTHHVKMRSTPNAQEQEAIVSETFIQDVRVLAVDQTLDNPENKAILAKTISVEVTPDEAQRIAVAEDMGKISLTLRGLGADTVAQSAPKEEKASTEEDPFIAPGATTAEPEHRLTRDTDVSPLLDQKSGVSPRITVIRGDASEQHQFYQNGQ